MGALNSEPDVIAGYDERMARIEHSHAQLDEILAVLAQRLTAVDGPTLTSQERLEERDRLKAARKALAGALHDLARFDDAIQSRRVLKAGAAAVTRRRA